MASKIDALVGVIVDEISSNVLDSTLIEEEQQRLATSLQPLLSLEPNNNQSAVSIIINSIIDEKQRNVMRCMMRNITEQTNESTTSKQRATMKRMSELVGKVVAEEHDNVVRKVEWLLTRVLADQRRVTVAELGSSIPDVIERRVPAISKLVRTRLHHMLRHELSTLLPRMNSASRLKTNNQQAYIQLVDDERDLVKRHMQVLVQQITDDERSLIFQQLRPVIRYILLEEPRKVITKMATLVTHLIRDEQRVVKLRINVLRNGVVEQQRKVVLKLDQIVKNVIGEQESALMKMTSSIVDAVHTEEESVLSKLENASAFFTQQQSSQDDGK